MLPSLNVPVAVFCCVDAGASTDVAGLTVIEVRVTELTFKGADPVTPLRVAVIFAVPGATAVVRPALPTVATAGLPDAQVTSRLMTCVLESLNDPVAVNDNLVAGARVRPVGVTEIDMIVALVTSSVVEALAGPSVALMVAVPGLRPLASPPALLIVATPVLDEVHAD